MNEARSSAGSPDTGTALKTSQRLQIIWSSGTPRFMLCRTLALQKRIASAWNERQNWHASTSHWSTLVVLVWALSICVALAKRTRALCPSRGGRVPRHLLVAAYSHLAAVASVHLRRLPNLPRYPSSCLLDYLYQFAYRHTPLFISLFAGQSVCLSIHAICTNRLSSNLVECYLF